MLLYKNRQKKERFFTGFYVVKKNLNIKNGKQIQYDTYNI